MKLHRLKSAIFTLGGILLLAVAIGGAMATNRTHSPASTQTQVKTKPPTGQPQKVAVSDTTPPPATSSTNTKADTATTSTACKLLTLAVAQKALGPDTRTSPPGDTASFQASNTAVSACAYANTIGSVQLIVRTPTDALGVSKNAVVFGSGRPQDAVAVQGYGQAAYWDPSKHSLNILGNNNWYVVARSTGTQSDAEATAKLLASGF